MTRGGCAPLYGLLGFENGGRLGVEVDFDFLAVVVKTVDFVALALADLESLDLIALGFDARTEVGFLHPFLLWHVTGRAGESRGGDKGGYGGEQGGEHFVHRYFLSQVEVIGRLPSFWEHGTD